MSVDVITAQFILLFLIYRLTSNSQQGVALVVLDNLLLDLIYGCCVARKLALVIGFVLVLQHWSSHWNTEQMQIEIIAPGKPNLDKKQK